MQAHGRCAPTGPEALRLKGPPVETIKVDAEIDATDQLETPEQFADAVQHGIHPQLAALEALVSPTSTALNASEALAHAGSLEIVPMQAPLTLFVWSAEPHRAGPHHGSSASPKRRSTRRSTRCGPRSASGCACSPSTTSASSTRAGTLFMALPAEEGALAGRAPTGTFGALGITGITAT